MFPNCTFLDKSTTYSWDNSNNHPTLYINENGYSGYLTKYSWSASPSVRVNNSDGSYTITFTATGYYSGTLTKTVNVYNYYVTVYYYTMEQEVNGSKEGNCLVPVTTEGGIAIYGLTYYISHDICYNRVQNYYCITKCFGTTYLYNFEGEGAAGVEDLFVACGEINIICNGTSLGLISLAPDYGQFMDPVTYKTRHSISNQTLPFTIASNLILAKGSNVINNPNSALFPIITINNFDIAIQY